jgi:hypothetical protein
LILIPTTILKSISDKTSELDAEYLLTWHKSASGHLIFF